MTDGQEPSRRRNDLGRGAHRGTPLCASLECLTLKHRAAPYRLCRTHAHGASRYDRTQDVSRGLARRPSPSPSEEPLRRRDVQSAKPGRVCVQGLGTSRRETGEGHRAEPQHCTCPAPWGSCSIKPADADSTETGIWCEVSGVTAHARQSRDGRQTSKFSFVDRGGRAQRNPCTLGVQICTPTPEGGRAECHQMPDSDPVTQRLHSRVPQSGAV